MSKTLQTPEFKNEAEEAAWWDANPDTAFGVLQQAAVDGTLGRGTLARRLAPTSIRLDTADIVLAKEQAQKRGIGYQTYLKMIIRQHLREEAATDRSKSL